MRFLPVIKTNGAKQMAIDEAMLEARAKGLIPNTLRFFTWKPSCVTIGYFQSAKREVDFEKAKELGVDVVRRYTGGGAVFHDAELTYSLVMGEDELPKDIVKSYEIICSFIVKGLEKLGIKGTFHPINDIIVNGRKISGNAQTRKKGVLLQHGTILLDIDVDKMFSLLLVPDEKLKDKMIKVVKDRVTCLNQEAREKVPFDALIESFKEGFEETFNTALEPGNLTEFEIMEAERLAKEKYGSEEYLQCR